MDSQYSGRVAVITGAGRGLGKAFAQAIAERGGRVVLSDVDEDVGASAAAEIARRGGQAFAIGCDVADSQQVQHLIDQAHHHYGGIDILINNAGLHSATYNQTMDVLGLQRIRALFDVNVMGTIACTLAARSVMAGREGACVLNLSSSRSYSASSAYGVSKLAVRGITVALAHELASDRIRVNCVAPGLMLTETIKTELSADIIAAEQSQQLLALDGAPQDIVNAMLFLCSAKARFITGETLRVTAGSTLGL